MNESESRVHFVYAALDQRYRGVLNQDKDEVIHHSVRNMPLFDPLMVSNTNIQHCKEHREELGTGKRGGIHVSGLQ